MICLWLTRVPPQKIKLAILKMFIYFLQQTICLTFWLLWVYWRAKVGPNERHRTHLLCDLHSFYFLFVLCLIRMMIRKIQTSQLIDWGSLQLFFPCQTLFLASRDHFSFLFLSLWPVPDPPTDGAFSHSCFFFPLFFVCRTPLFFYLWLVHDPPFAGAFSHSCFFLFLFLVCQTPHHHHIDIAMWNQLVFLLVQIVMICQYCSSIWFYFPTAQ